MKTMHKILALVLALTMVMGLATTAFATQEGTLDDGSITIDNAVVGQTYNAYQILYLESYNPDTGAYAYKANSAWAEWLKTQTAYVSIDGQGYVTWVNDASAADFAKLAQVEAAKMTADATAKAETTTVKLENLKLGYYLVDTTLGTLCSLDTTNPDVTMKEKNETPSVEKEVEEDSNGKWGETNDADFNQAVNYKATITVQTGAENYILHDTMSKGLTYTGVTSVTVGGVKVSADNYTVTAADTCGCTFEVAFTNDYIASLDAGTKIVVAYSATLNENAVVGLDGNPNEIKLQYGDKNQPSYTPVDTTITYTWDVDVLKYANDDESKVLADAKFVLLNNDKTAVANVVNGKLVGWVTITEEFDLATYALTTNENGKIEIDGLDADTYYLREIKAPAGYNKLSEDVEVVITGATTNTETETLEYSTVVAKVNNQSGSVLPETGGMGTTLFYVIGGILVLAAVVLLVTKKRMATAE